MTIKELKNEFKKFKIKNKWDWKTCDNSKTWNGSSIWNIKRNRKIRNKKSW